MGEAPFRIAFRCAVASDEALAIAKSLRSEATARTEVSEASVGTSATIKKRSWDN